LGDVDLAAYASLIAALESGRFEDFENVVLGGPRPLANPESAYAFVLDGGDPHDFFVPPAPTFASAQTQSEAAEDYWMALLRDVPFDEYATSLLAQAAAVDLSRFSDFCGPKVAGRVTPQTLFRWEAPGTLAGPYVSQFLVLDVPYGVQSFAQKNVARVPGDDRLTDFAAWLAVQNVLGLRRPHAGKARRAGPSTAARLREGRPARWSSVCAESASWALLSPRP
jgi:hypothetical protein